MGMDDDRDKNNFSVATGELNIAFRARTEVPEDFARKEGPFVYTLNLTETGIVSLSTLRHFKHLKTLILDQNGLEGLRDCPVLESVTTLWFNNNKVSDLPAFMDDVVRTFPNLTYLSMMRNPAAPGLMDIVQPDLKACKLYRLYVLYRMPRLRTLDATEVTNQERLEARQRGHFAAKRVPLKQQYDERRGGLRGGMWKHEREVLSPPPPPPPSQERGKGGAFLAVCKKKYDGRHSEGNRFIVDSEL